MPNGVELLQRENREVDQIDHIMELYEDRTKFSEKPLPTLSDLLNYTYVSDELHKHHSTYVSIYEVCNYHGVFFRTR